MTRAAATIPPVPGRRKPSARPIRLMIVDDSIIARSVFTRLLETEADLEIAASLPGARQAIAALDTMTVDVILLDLEMPGMGGLEALPLIIKAARGARVLVVSSHTGEGAEHTLAALAKGAADTLAKPASGHFKGAYPEALLRKIRALVRNPASSLRRSEKPLQVHPVRPQPAVRPGVLAIGSSTGGIHAIGLLFEALPPSMGIPILITQHLPPQFMPIFARQLSAATGYEAAVAADDEPLVANRILIAPGGAHLMVRAKAGRMRVHLSHEKSESGFMPSVDPMFDSLADTLGQRALGVVLSGMGRDGIIGARRIVEVGGTVMAQDEQSSSVWGMPRAVAEAGLASSILSPAGLADKIADSLEGEAWN
jgi:two-component system chemotaxis response regulator CheB